MATAIRQEKVREECISFTARMDRRHRPTYPLDAVRRPHFRRIKPGHHKRTQSGFLTTTSRDLHKVREATQTLPLLPIVGRRVSC